MNYCDVRKIWFPDHSGASHPDDQPATVKHGGHWYCEDCYDCLVLGGEPGARWWYEGGDGVETMRLGRRETKHCSLPFHRCFIACPSTLTDFHIPM